ncbi:unnamed protein product [Strongylus vulgaris]|uniref:Uncharacterized protein n=1 Tax=Strongylus vulgaris TaxID=40348 RepID=A0A3P7J2K9_STRVU|nr:unnamed protein product [Strongylus vulgaris]
MRRKVGHVIQYVNDRHEPMKTFREHAQFSFLTFVNAMERFFGTVLAAAPGFIVYVATSVQKQDHLTRKPEILYKFHKIVIIDLSHVPSVDKQAHNKSVEHTEVYRLGCQI